MNSTEVFRKLARYNRIANETLYEKCAELHDAEYRRQRPGSFGSIHALLNHTLLADRIWMSRFQGGGQTTPPLNTVLHEDFASLRSARVQEDKDMEEFFGSLDEPSADRTIAYTNSKGRHCVDSMILGVLHMFNHQTHHRGQIHVMLSQAGVQPPSLDMHRILNP